MVARLFRAARMVAVASLCGLGWVAAASAQTSGAAADLVSRGRYLTQAGDCVACHTVANGRSFAGGLPFALPFGTLYSPNITPDRETGIGAWSDDDFVSALQNGVGPNGKHYYPAFPYTSYTQMSRDDILAIKAYLFSLPPQKATIPENTLQFPFNQRWGMAFWNAAFFSNHRFAADAGKSAAWNRGAYLVESLGHCGECHTPRAITQNMDMSQKLGGTVVQGWKAYNLTADAQSGLAGWSDDQLASYLSTGHADGHSSAAGPMSEVVENSLRFLSQEDIRAIVTYLRDIPAIRNAPAVATNPPAVQAGAAPSPTDDLGARIFAGECSNCHLQNGAASQDPHAALIGNRTVNDPDATNLINVVLNGVRARMGTGLVFMPPFARNHSNDELAAVVNFVNHRFGNGLSAVTADQVEAIRNPKPQSIPDWVLWAGIVGAIVVALLVIWLLVRVFRRNGRRPTRRLMPA